MIRVAVAVEQNWNRTPGGTAISTNRLLTALISDGRVEVVGVAGRHLRPPTLPLPPGLELVVVPLPGRALQQWWSRRRRPTIDRWIDSVDVVHGPAYVLPPSNRPTVATIHDLAFRHRPDWFTANGVRFMERFVGRVVAGRQPVLVPSAATASDCVDAGIAEDRLHIVPWGGGEGDGEHLDRATTATHGLCGTEVLYVGTLEPRKNLDGLARAMQRLPGRQLVIAGPDGWGSVVPPAGARSLGYVSDVEVAAVMGAARVLVYPSHLEGFGLPVLEAMSVGTPVITTAGTAPAWVAGSGGLAVDTSDPAALADAIESVLSDDALHARLAAAGRERARRFTWAAAAAGTVGAYERAAGR